MFSAPTLIQPTRYPTSAFVLGYHVTPDALAFVKHWRSLGYPEKSIWDGFATIAGKQITNSYAFECITTPIQVPDLASQMAYLLPGMMPAVNIASMIRNQIDTPDVVILLSSMAWKLILSVDHFPF